MSHFTMLFRFVSTASLQPSCYIMFPHRPVPRKKILGRAKDRGSVRVPTIGLKQRSSEGVWTTTTSAPRTRRCGARRRPPCAARTRRCRRSKATRTTHSPTAAGTGEPRPHAQQVIASHADAFRKGKNAAAMRGKLVQNLHVADVQRLLLGESSPPPAGCVGGSVLTRAR
jgi:hypothetical protein